LPDYAAAEISQSPLFLPFFYSELRHHIGYRTAKERWHAMKNPYRCLISFLHAEKKSSGNGLAAKPLAVLSEEEFRRLPLHEQEELPKTSGA
jgi:hypothetical protein